MQAAAADEAPGYEAQPAISLITLEALAPTQQGVPAAVARDLLSLASRCT